MPAVEFQTARAALRGLASMRTTPRFSYSEAFAILNNFYFMPQSDLILSIISARQEIMDFLRRFFLGDMMTKFYAKTAMIIAALSMALLSGGFAQAHSIASKFRNANGVKYRGRCCRNRRALIWSSFLKYGN